MYTYPEIIKNYSILKQYMSREKVPMICMKCNSSYKQPCNDIQSKIKSGRTKNYCSIKCRNNSLSFKIETSCKECDKTIYKIKKDFKKSKNHFCSRSCSAKYNNRNKLHGTNSSKLELWLQEKLMGIYPNMDFSFNDRSTIGLELDILIPSLKVAFEINGIVHYKAIYGNKKFKDILKNDYERKLLCESKDFNLFIIDTSDQKNFEKSTSIKYLNQITSVINELVEGIEPS